MRQLRICLLVLGTIALLVGSAQAQDPSNFPVQYMVKYVCGLAPPQPAGEEPPVKPGNYATAINIHNYTRSTLFGGMRPALHYPILTPSGGVPIPSAVRFPIANRKVVEIDCPAIWARLNVPPSTFLKGMVHIGLNVPLPVVAVYTSQTDLDINNPPAPDAGISIDVEYIDPFLMSSPAAPFQDR